MSNSAEELYSLLVPLAEDRLIVPRACVAEVIRFSRPEHVDGSADWFIGTMNWTGRMIPVVSFEAMLGRMIPEASGRSRVVVFHAVNNAMRGKYYGVMTQGFPQLVRVNRDVLQVDPSTAYAEDDPVVTRVRMINEYPLIPDLEVLEEKLIAEQRQD